MKPRHRRDFALYRDRLRHVAANVRQLPGIQPAGHLETLVCQIIDSVRRIDFVRRISREYAGISPLRADPNSDLFDPLKGAIWHYHQQNHDEACWLVFLATHFGKHAVDGWRLCRDIYGKLGGPGRWDWHSISPNPDAFRLWLNQNIARLRGDGVRRRFSNHRKYESLLSPNGSGTADVLSSYVAWIAPPRSHREFVMRAHREVGQNPRDVFAYLYKSMKAVDRFGRLGRFDFLTMLGKLDLAPIEPDSAYLKGATGPALGAKLLFLGSPTARCNPDTLQNYLDELDETLSIGMQALEDSLCNWQKSPARYRLFRG